MSTTVPIAPPRLPTRPKHHRAAILGRSTAGTAKTYRPSQVYARNRILVVAIAMLDGGQEDATMAEQPRSTIQPVSLLLPMAGSLFGFAWRNHPSGLTGDQALVLLRLSQQDAQIMRQIGRHLRIDPPTLTSIVDRLELAGLVERRRYPTGDRRAVFLYLTELGRQAVANVPAWLQQRDAALLAILLTAAERAKGRDDIGGYSHE
jgi:DNA-binding MarR family transcriptional regulator